jgi:hypothetical protein
MEMKIDSFFYSSCCKAPFIGVKGRGEYWIACSMCGNIDWKLHKYKIYSAKKIKLKKKYSYTKGYGSFIGGKK